MNHVEYCCGPTRRWAAATYTPLRRDHHGRTAARIAVDLQEAAGHWRGTER